MASVRGRMSAIQDPVLLAEINAIWQAIQDRPQELSDAVASSMTDEKLMPLNRFLNGERQGHHILLYRTDDAGPTLYVAKTAGDLFEAAQFYGSSDDTSVVKITQSGDGVTLTLVGRNGTHAPLYIDCGAGAGRIINTSVGAYLSAGGVWTDAPCHSSKKTVVAVPNLDWAKTTVEDLHVSAWRHKSQPDGDIHYSPMAEEFHALTGAGDDQSIAALDVASIALLGVKWAAKKIDQLERRIAALEGRHGS